MRRLAIALTAAALAAAPWAAQAQGHEHDMGGRGMGTFSRPAGGTGHEFHGDFRGFRGDFRGFRGSHEFREFHEFHRCCFGRGLFAFDFFLTPWWYGGYPDYWWGYGPYDYPPPGPPPAAAAAGPAVCGNWVWQDGRYAWITAPCPASGAAPAAPPAPPG